MTTCTRTDAHALGDCSDYTTEGTAMDDDATHDAVAAAKRAAEAVRAHARELLALADERDERIRRAVTLGAAPRDVAAATGISTARVETLAR